MIIDNAAIKMQAGYHQQQRTDQFDIDANGSSEQIATLKSNSGMLALDKN